MPAGPLMMKAASVAHALAFRLSGGRLGGRINRLPILLLTTTGRRSHRPRTRPLVYLQDGPTFVLIASNGGNDDHPDWLFNLQADNRADIQLGAARQPVVATTASEEERQRLWPRAVELWPGYAEYQRGTRRTIPLVVLTPVQELQGRD